MHKLLALLFLTHSLLSQAQELSHIDYTVKDGLPGSDVYQCLQDRSGFMWFCTNQGVSRFDGKTFRNFSKEDGLPDNEILKLYLDAHGDVWFVSLKGTPSVYYNGGIYRLDTCKNVYAITEDFRTGDILLLTTRVIGSENHLGYYRSPDVPGHWSFIESLAPAFRQCATGPILRASSPAGTDFFFSTDSRGIHSVELSAPDGRTASYPFAGRSEYLPYDWKSFFTLTPDKQSIIFATDTVYIASGSGLRRLFALGDIHMDRNDLSDMYCENDSTLWLSSRSRGLVLMHNFQRGNRVAHTYFPGTFCTCIREDREGGHWVTTHDDGVFYIPSLEVRCVGGDGDLAGKNAKCIQALNDTTLAAGLSQGSIFLIDDRSIDGRSFAPPSLLRWAGAGGNRRVMEIKSFRKNRLAVAGDDGIYLIARNGATEALDARRSAKGLSCLENANIVYSAAEGVFQVNPATRALQHVFDSRSTCVAGMGNDFFWGTMDGLYAYNGGVVRYWGFLTPALRGVINHIDIGPDSTIWVSTQQGVVLIKNKRAVVLGKNEGMPSDLCKHVLPRKRVAWVSTDKGIARIVIDWNGPEPDIRISSITEDDGLVSDDVNQTAAASGYIWAATARGISFFPENYIPHSMGAPLININAPDTDYRDNKLTIALSGISFRSGKHITYQYRLKDLDTDWISTASNIIPFSALPYGTHSFEVRVVDRWGTVSGNIRRLSILVPPPFWKTPWFTGLTYLLTAVLIGLTVYVYVRVRHRKKERAFRLKAKMADLEMTALRAQMDPHFIFNCLSSIQYYILHADIKNANLYLHKLSGLIRKMLHHGGHSYITLADELSILELYMELEKLRLSERMEYSIEVDGDLVPQHIQIPALIIQPFVENSIKHGITPLRDKQGVVRVTFKRTGNYLVCTVDDNGIGIRAAQKARRAAGHAPVGISNIEHRVRIINMMRREGIALEIKDKAESMQEAHGTVTQIRFLL